MLAVPLRACKQDTLSKAEHYSLIGSLMEAHTGNLDHVEGIPVPSTSWRRTQKNERREVEKDALRNKKGADKKNGKVRTKV